MYTFFYICGMSKDKIQVDQIVLKNIRVETKQTLANIASNKGTTVVALLRLKINEVIREATEAEKTAPKKY